LKSAKTSLGIKNCISYNYGLSKILILLIHERFALLSYPPVSISLLNKQQLTELIAFLEHWKE